MPGVEFSNFFPRKQKYIFRGYCRVALRENSLETKLPKKKNLQKSTLGFNPTIVRYNDRYIKISQHN
jgi:hypothetical protein